MPVPLLLELVLAGLLPPEFAVLELLLHATAPISVAAARKAGALRRSARPAPLPCLVEIISSLAGRRAARPLAVSFVLSCAILSAK